MEENTYWTELSGLYYNFVSSSGAIPAGWSVISGAPSLSLLISRCDQCVEKYIILYSYSGWATTKTAEDDPDKSPAKTVTGKHGLIYHDDLINLTAENRFVPTGTTEARGHQSGHKPNQGVCKPWFGLVRHLRVFTHLPLTIRSVMVMQGNIHASCKFTSVLDILTNYRYIYFKDVCLCYGLFTIHRICIGKNTMKLDMTYIF